MRQEAKGSQVIAGGGESESVQPHRQGQAGPSPPRFDKADRRSQSEEGILVRCSFKKLDVRLAFVVADPGTCFRDAFLTRLHM
jgi:hypothetical protein